MGIMRKLRRAGIGAKYEVEPLRPQQSFHPRKMSEVILDFAQPLLEAIDDDELFEKAISCAVACWNLSFLPEKKQQNLLRSMLNEFGKYDPLMRLEADDCARMLLERKKALFADDRRMIVNYKIVNEKDGQRLLVMSTPVKD